MAEPQATSTRRDYIDILKGLGILLVVFGHFMEQYRLGSHLIGATFITIYWFHMALFCMCSGLVAHFSLRKLITQQFWLYLLGQAIMLAFRAFVLQEDFAASGGILMAFLLPWRHMWYLYALLFWHLTLPILTFLRDKLRLPGACIGLALAVALSLWAGTIDWLFTLVRVFAFYPFYAFGVLFRPQIDTLDRAASRFWAVRVVPGLLLALQEEYHLSDEQLLKGLFNAGAVGYLAMRNATVAGAVGGCQAEVGVAAAMAASAAVELLGGPPGQCLDAASTVLMNMLGLVCDPVGGLVEYPCQSRNAAGVANALVAAELALSGVRQLIPFDEMLDAMYAVGRRLPVELRETALGGCAATPSACERCGCCT